MDFAPDARTREYVTRTEAFLDEHVLPAEPDARAQLAAEPGRWGPPPVVRALQARAREAGLWNLFLPGEHGAGLTNLQYAPVAELTGSRPRLAPVALNCAAPDTGNMELLADFGTPEQQARWLEPLLRAEIRSTFCMTEPDVASSDANQIGTTIRRDGDEYVITGRKWWSTGAMNPDAQLLIVMGEDRPGRGPAPAAEHGAGPAGHPRRPGRAAAERLRLRRPRPRRARRDRLRGRPGAGRRHPRRRRARGSRSPRPGSAPAGSTTACAPSAWPSAPSTWSGSAPPSRSRFGRPLAEQGVVREWVAESRIQIEALRLLVLKTAWLMDTVGNSRP